MALSLILLVAAALLLQSFARLTRVHVGFNADGLVTMRLSLPTPKYSEPAAMRSLADRLVNRLDAAAGVGGAAVAASRAAGRDDDGAVHSREMRRSSASASGRSVSGRRSRRPISPRWAFHCSRAARSRTRRRTRAAGGRRQQGACAIARGPVSPPIGKKLLVGRFPGFADVVGVVGDVKNAGLMAAPLPEMYTPYPQRPWPSFGLVVRTERGLQIVNQVRAVLAEIDPDLPVTRVQTVDAAFSGFDRDDAPDRDVAHWRLPPSRWRWRPPASTASSPMRSRDGAGDWGPRRARRGSAFRRQRWSSGKCCR